MEFDVGGGGIDRGPAEGVSYMTAEAAMVVFGDEGAAVVLVVVAGAGVVVLGSG